MNSPSIQFKITLFFDLSFQQITKPKMTLISRLLTVLLCGFFLSTHAQKPKIYHAGEIQQQLDKLNVLGTVLYVAAHPDDENTRLIAYYANEKLFRTAYLSATRGDGGQNLIGPEIREKLGLIRTQELLAARRTDGGTQFFSRANDFGYSKHPDETLTIWEKEKVLSDFVRVIRKFKPDVIITRFSTEPGVTHGHHTTSAILAEEAFDLAGNPDAFPEQLEDLEVWQPKKLFWNTSWWFYRRTGRKFDPTGLKPVDVGTYNSLLGKSYTEVAAESRSMHKSQGFGATGSRGSEIEYLKPIKGDTTGDIFKGIDTSWGRVTGSDNLSYFLDEASKSYNASEPWKTLENLYSAREELLKLPDQFWKEIKLRDLDNVVKALTGTYLEVTTDDFSYVTGDSITFKVESINRVDTDLELSEVVIEPLGFRNVIGQKLKANSKFTTDFKTIVPDGLNGSNPYWLNKHATLGMYHVDDPNLIGTPENESIFKARFIVKWQDHFLEYETPISFKRNDPVDGETYRPVVIAPPAMVNLDNEIIVFGSNEAKEVEARVISGNTNVKGVLKIKGPEGWIVEPTSFSFELKQKNEEKLFRFSITPPEGAHQVKLTAELEFEDGRVSSKGKQVIEYDHIPTQTLFPAAEIQLVKLDLKKNGNLIGYIPGAGDAVPENLRQIGYNVQILSKDDVVSQELSRFDAVILGVRAFNTIDWLAYKNQELFNYVKEGGNVIVQYNTSHRLVTQEIAPYPIKLSRDRVAVETAEVRILDPDHPILNYPNRITKDDFENWVQERGLYFPTEWDPKFSAILSSNDPGESPKDGGLIVAKHGNGYYIYTGYSWFRELPAGVPGAYRIFVNLISAGKNKEQ